MGGPWRWKCCVVPRQVVSAMVGRDLVLVLRDRPGGGGR